MRITVLGAAILAALIGLSGCGQRGPLYLPPPATDKTPDKPGTDPARH